MLSNHRKYLTIVLNENKNGKTNSLLMEIDVNQEEGRLLLPHKKQRTNERTNFE